MSADDRPAYDAVGAIRALQKEVADLKTTVLYRASRLPTGTIVPTLLASESSETLFLNGQTVSRETYAVLWDWVNAHSLIGTGKFTNGDGSTTFGLPNWSGRYLVCAGTLSPDTYAVGATGGLSRLTLTLAQMPQHNHGSVDNHEHYIQVNSVNSHGGHVFSSVTRTAGGDLAAHPSTSSEGGHNHDGYTANAGGHAHADNGSGSEIDARPPFVVSNWVIWT